MVATTTNKLGPGWGEVFPRVSANRRIATRNGCDMRNGSLDIWATVLVAHISLPFCHMRCIMLSSRTCWTMCVSDMTKCGSGNWGWMVKRWRNNRKKMTKCICKEKKWSLCRFIGHLNRTVKRITDYWYRYSYLVMKNVLYTNLFYNNTNFNLFR